MPKGAPSRCAWAIRAAAISDFEGTQPQFRQSPPISPRSTSTTSRPSWAAPAATTRPAEPPPTTQTSGVKAVMSRLATAQPRVEHGQQGERGEAQQRQQDAPFEDDAEIRLLAAIEQQAEARAHAGIDDRRGNDADHGGERIGREAHADQGRKDVDQ